MTWEYLVEGVPTCQGSNVGIVKVADPKEMVAAHLNMRGKQGWELVQVDHLALHGGSPYWFGVVFYFKRQEKTP